MAAHFGAVHQIYNNAGIAFSRSVLDSEWADYERVMSVNLWGTLHGTKLFLPHLIASGDGHVVNVSSLNGIKVTDGSPRLPSTEHDYRGGAWGMVPAKARSTSSASCALGW